MVIHSVDAQGRVAITISATTYWMEPGQEWAQHSERPSTFDATCIYQQTYRLTNHGLLDRAQVQVRGE
jgi:hypothetical protein